MAIEILHAEVEGIAVLRDAVQSFERLQRELEYEKGRRIGLELERVTMEKLEQIHERRLDAILAAAGGSLSREDMASEKWEPALSTRALLAVFALRERLASFEPHRGEGAPTAAATLVNP